MSRIVCNRDEGETSFFVLPGLLRFQLVIDRHRPVGFGLVALFSKLTGKREPRLAEPWIIYNSFLIFLGSITVAALFFKSWPI